MRRLKRDMNQRAHKQGYVQGLRGHAKELCPYTEANKRGQWLGGWRVGHEDYAKGFRSLTE